MPPTQEQNPDGLHQRYRVEKLDGENDPEAVYLVLRLDQGGDDQIWTECCRRAAVFLGHTLAKFKHKPQLAEEITRLALELDE